MLIEATKKQFFILIVAFSSIATAAFGIWHFFIPAQWDWYSFISPEAPELVVAVGAVNAIFSLCLVLIGIADLLIVLVGTDRFARIVMLSLSSIMFSTRVLLPFVAPQGSAMPALQVGMLAGFLLIWGCFAVALWIEIKS